MNRLHVDDVVQAFSNGVAVGGGDYGILPDTSDGVSVAYLARASSGAPSLLVPVAGAASETTRLTQGLAFRSIPNVEFTRATHRWRAPAAVLECRDPKLLRTFAAMATSLIARLESSGRPTWAVVTNLFGEWEKLLARRTVLATEHELGLWGELWWLSRTSRPDALLDAWRGPEGSHVDFLLGARGFEMKTSRRAGVHHVSQAQVDEPYGDVPTTFVSVFVAIDPLKGVALPELVLRVEQLATERPAFQEKLAATGYSHDDASCYSSKYIVLERPSYFPADAVPRVRAADAGVSDLRYRVEMDPMHALHGTALEDCLATLGVDTNTMEYPCA